MFYALSSPEHETKRVRFDIHWHPYQLDPQAPLVPILKSKLYTRKFGPDQAIFVRDRVVQAAKVEGIEFLPADQCLYRNTLISHRLIKYARERLGRELFEASFKSRHTNIDNNSSISRIENDDDGEQKGEEEEEEEEEEEIDEFGNMVEDAMVEELFHSHFERGECGDIPTLKKCARNVLLALAADHAAAGNEPVDTEKIEREVEEIERYLATDEDLQQIMDEIQVAKHQMGFHGVPTIVVQSMYLVPGGQDCATFVEIFKRVV
ncbi:hypothetical protein BGZ58_001864 [Dissophora ornata]|nr:hypothetical protein BGZ58_001864 [Dissophora ornata]